MIGQALLVRIGVGAVVAGLLLGFVWHQGGKAARADLKEERRAHAETKRQHAQVLREQAARAAEVARLTKTASAAVKRDRIQNDDRFKEQEHASSRAINDLRRKLRAGDVSLQPWWSCPAPGGEAGDAAAIAGGHDGYAGLRLESALEVVSDADRADRWIEWLQAELASTRQALIASRLAVEEIQ